MTRATLTLWFLGLAGCHAAGGQATPMPDGGSPVPATVHEVLTRPSLTGRLVQVRGTCLGYSTPTVAAGAPPATRSDWQLEDQGEAVWVTGALPTGCSATQPAAAPSTITALVAQDTLPGLGGRPGVARRFLINR